MGLTATDYRTQLQQLLPQGVAWPREPGAVLTQLLDAAGEEFARTDVYIERLVEEMLPDSTQQLLPEWEAVVGLPGECSDQVRVDLQGRHVDLLAKLRATGGQSADYYADVAAFYGVPVTVEEHRPFRAGTSAAGDPLTNGDWVFSWSLRAPSLQEDAGAQATFECLFSSLAPSHTILNFTYRAPAGLQALRLQTGGVLLGTQGGSALLLAEKT
ncbi:YmfQ family protein [Stenotrophomonas maltophilia]|uniref:YmfQ family protein n=1 Tax=Stenotrophomonas maltophilia TaxID=40324 RepID=UPI0013D90CDB|nr:putative phage tail protein [Stenotrophomonas maltophilia]